MKAIQTPVPPYYDTCLTDEFKSLVQEAEQKIWPFVKKERASTSVYYEVKGEDSGELTCDSEKCIKYAKKAIREAYGKYTRVQEVYFDNDGDHDKIEICMSCGIPLNEWLTWADDELQRLEETNEWDQEFLLDEAFEIHCILQSLPTCDNRISEYDRHQGGEILENAIEEQEKFYQRVLRLAQAVIGSEFKTEEQDD